jgi:membrane protein DedA with SNARE-associated domain
MQTILDATMAQSGMAPYLIVFVILLFCGFGLPIPEDIVLFAAGLTVFYQHADIYVMLAVTFAGVMIGDCSVFTIGALFGKKLRKRPFVRRFLPPARQRQVRKKLHDQGNKVIFAARFMPGMRTPIFFICGTLHLPFRVFLFYDGLAALISVPAIVFATFYFGQHVDQVISAVKRLQFGVIGTILIISAVIGLKAWWAHKKKNEGKSLS